ncbi:MAG: BrnT family toxin [Rhodospirillaceae bacterium]
MDFDWHERKCESNLLKHGIDFEDAIRLWEGLVIEKYSVHAGGEPRTKAIGMVDGQVLTIIYTWRGAVRRLISARRADKNERRTYHTTVTEGCEAGQDGLGPGRRPH